MYLAQGTGLTDAEFKDAFSSLCYFKSVLNLCDTSKFTVIITQPCCMSCYSIYMDNKRKHLIYRLAYENKLTFDDAWATYESFRHSMGVVYKEERFYWNIPEFKDICHYKAHRFRDVSNFVYIPIVQPHDISFE